MIKVLRCFLSLLMVICLTACGADETVSVIDLTETSNEASSEQEKENELDEEDTENNSFEKASSDVKSSSKVKDNSNNQSKRPYYSSSSGENSSSKVSKTSTSSEKKYPTKQKIITIRKNNQNSFKKVGRWDNDDYGLGVSLNWSCSSVEFNVDCKGDLAIEFIKGSGTNPLYMEISVDGKLISERTKIKSSGEMVIATALEPGIHNVKIVRQTDVEGPTFTLYKILAYGNLAAPPKDNPLYIEAVGDATLIGWGVRLDDAFYSDFKANQSQKQPIARNKENQDGTLVYSYLAAEKLGADSYTLARQGAGIAATYHKSSGDGYCSPRAGLLPTMYEFTHTSGNKEYEATRLPDVIVIDAGSADLSTSLLACVKDGNNVGIDSNRAIAISSEFLKSLKQKSPKAKIIWCYGLTRDNEQLKDYITKATEMAGGEKSGIYTLKLPLASRGDYPSAKEHQAAATVLAGKIKQITEK